MTQQKNDRLTVAAIGLLAMCVIPFDHEALGHGSACLAMHGRILELSSSVFRCDVQSGLIALAGPTCNILCGLIALMVRLLLPPRFVKLRLFLILVTAFSFFWEGGYLIRAMHHAYGDSYFFLQWWLGTVTVWQRWVAALLGLGLYLFSVRLTARALLGMWPQAKIARSVARMVWVSATIGATLAGLAYKGHVSGDFRDAVLEIGVAAIPLLWIPIRESIRGPVRESRDADTSPATAILRSNPVIFLSAAVYIVFIWTLGRGLP